MTPNPSNPTQTEDWVMVKREPDAAMLAAADRVGNQFAGSDLSSDEMTRAVWTAMLSAAPTISPGMSELVEKALADLLADLNEADEWLGAARTRRRNAAVKNATKRLASTLLDDLAAAQGEIERLREALQMMVDEEVDYMTRNKLGDPEKQHTIRVARSALTLKSEEKQGLDLVALLTDTAEGMNELANGLEEDGGYTATVAEIRAQVAMIVAATKTQAPGDGVQQVKP
jgi:hypothetical protein